MARTAEALNDSSDDIDTALDALADVSATLDQQRATTNAALRDVAPAARVLRQNTDELVALLRSIDRFGAVTTDVVDATRDDLLSTLKAMGPVFDELNALEDELGPGIDTLVHFAGLVDRGVPTDYLNTYLHFQGELSIGLPGTPLGAPRVLTPNLDNPKGLLGGPLVGGLKPKPSTQEQSGGLLGGLLGLFGGGG
jgi:phospholipid/cholesterol/gamma-HCH transport system substrate-binding protein